MPEAQQTHAIECKGRVKNPSHGNRPLKGRGGTPHFRQVFGNELSVEGGRGGTPFPLKTNLLKLAPICIAILPDIALLVSSVSIELVSSSARVTSVKSAEPLRQRPIPIDQTPGTHGSDKKQQICISTWQWSLEAP